MDALRAREQLRRRYRFSLDAEASRDGRGCTEQGEALLRARSEPGRAEVPRPGPGPDAVPQPRPAGRDRASFLRVYQQFARPEFSVVKDP